MKESEFLQFDIKNIVNFEKMDFLRFEKAHFSRV